MPNQSKGTSTSKNQHSSHMAGIHRIIHGKMEDFIVHHIPENSIRLEFIDKSQVDDKQKQKHKHKQKQKQKQKQNNEYKILDQRLNMSIGCDTRNNILSNSIEKPYIYQQFFDKCYKQERFGNFIFVIFSFFIFSFFFNTFLLNY